MNSIEELFLTEYFMATAVLGAFINNAKSFFYSLAKLFMLSDETVEELYKLTRTAEVKNIKSEQDFMQHLRIKKYLQMNELPNPVNAVVEEMINVKGNALMTAANSHLVSEADVAGNTLYGTLTSAAEQGNVHALRLVGILQCEGVFFEKNLSQGIKNLTKAADWNDCVSLLALMNYDEKGRVFNSSRLYMAVAGTPFEGIYYAVNRKFNTGEPQEIPEVKLLNKSFKLGVLKRETYEPKYARVLYGSALCYNDKARAMAAESKELLSVYADLPLKLAQRNDSDAFGKDLKTALCRADEQEKLTRALGNADLRRFASYRPLCICSDSEYLLNAYADALVKSYGGHIEKIEAGTLSDYDLEPTANNVFVRSINERLDNCFMLFAVGDVPERAESAVKNFLQSDKRAKFHLNNPNVTLDLSGILPVCFCDGKNLKWIKDYCDVVCLSPIAESETERVIRDLVDSKSRLYRASVTLNADAVEYLKSCPVDAVDDVIDCAIRAYRVKVPVVLTREMLVRFAANDGGDMKIGFGGNVK